VYVFPQHQIAKPDRRDPIAALGAGRGPVPGGDRVGYAGTPPSGLPHRGARRTDRGDERDDDARGPFDVDTTGLPIDWVSNPGLSNVEVAVLGPHDLFQSHQTIKLGPINTGEIWDDATYWAACDWRF
jgi:hypothetical protein